MKHDRAKVHRLLGALGLTLALYFLFCISGRLYTFTDNITVGVVTSGMYGDNNMCQYLHPLLCLIVKWLNPILPTADVYATLTHLALLSGIFLIAYAAIEAAFRKPAKNWTIEEIISLALMLLAIVYFTLGLKLFGVNYTVQTSAIIAEGVVVLAVAIQGEKGRAWIIAGTGMIFAGFLGRTEACLLFLPFLALGLLTEIVRTKTAWIRKNGLYILPPIMVMIVLLGSKAVFLNIEPYRSDAAYNHYRTIAEDYPMETFGVSYKDFSGVDHSTYNMVTHWILADTDLINANTLKNIAEVGSRNDYQYTSQGLKRALQEMMRQSTRVDVHLMTLVALTLLFTLWNAVAVKSTWLKLESVLCTLGAFIILFYFTFRGRAPIRVWQCVGISALTTHVLIMVKDARDRRNAVENCGIYTAPQISGAKVRTRTGTAIFQLLLCVVLYFGLGQVLAHSTIHAPALPLTSRSGVDDSGYAATFEEDALYLWPSWYSTVMPYYSEQDKLPTQRFIEHNIALGDWIYGQVYFRDFLNHIDAGNPAIALLERPNTYVVEGLNEVLMQHMHAHYGEDIRMEYVRNVNGYKAYRLTKGD